jgi:hypothetical protein
MKTDLKSHIGITMSLDQVVKILDKQLANDYVLFTKTLTLGSAAVVIHS